MIQMMNIKDKCL